MNRIENSFDNFKDFKDSLTTVIDDIKSFDTFFPSTIDIKKMKIGLEYL